MKSEPIQIKRERVAEILLSARVQRDISLEELAEKVGFKAGTIERIEQGRFSPNADQLYAICEALDLRITIDGESI